MGNTCTCIPIQFIISMKDSFDIAKKKKKEAAGQEREPS